MKIIMIEATAEELRSNKRVMDTIVDAFSEMADGIIRGDITIPIMDDEEEVKADADSD